ncbi:DNA polymerase I [bacterium]|nr:MAG: DNA polymerase I [bacterium]
MVESKIFLIDATAFCYRAFYAVKGLVTTFGQPTNAIYGFINMLNKILKEKKPEYLAVCFDVSRDTFRLKKFSGYKMQRPPMPDNLVSQIPLIKEIISAYGFAIFEKEGYEADDLIATLKSKARKKGLAVSIVSSDKDMLQLVDGHTVVFNPYKDKGTIYSEDTVVEPFGVSPSGLNDILVLMGDATDNIPGIPGISEKIAVGLINNFGTVEKLLNNTAKIPSTKIRQAIEQNRDKIKLNQELCRLDDKIDLEFDLDKLKIVKPDTKELLRLFQYLEFKKLIKNLLLPEVKEEKKDLVVAKGREIKRLVDIGGEVVLYGSVTDDLVFSEQGIFFQLKDKGIYLKNILTSSKVKKIGHDLKKLKVALAKDNILLGGIFFDTMIAGYLLNPARSNESLFDTSWDYLGLVPTAKAVDSLKAVDLISQLKPALERELKNKSLEKLFWEIEMPLVNVLADMEINGIKLDRGVLRELSKDIEKRLAKLIEDIFRISACQFNINSPKQLRQILFEKLRLPIIKKGKTGPSTDEEVLKSLSSKHQLPALLLEYRQLTKLKTTYIDALPDLVNPKTGRVHTCFKQTATETGRLSSVNPNLQNIPIKTNIGRQIRRAIVVADAEYCLLSCDYSQIELRILAHISKDSNLISAFRNDEDIHCSTASLIYGIELRDVAEAMRETAKRVNFGITYGLTAYGLSRDLGITIEQAQAFIEAYFARFPGVKGYIQEQIQRAERDGFVTTILGRRRYLPEINNKNQGIRQFTQRQAVNTPIQGSASDLIKLAMVNIHREIEHRKLPLKMILQIHDELLFEAPSRGLREFIELVKDKMENVLKLEVPVRVDIKKGKNWLEMEPVLEQVGR